MRFMQLIFDILFPPKQRALRAPAVTHEALAALAHPIRIATTDPPVISLLPYRNLLVQAAITEAKFHDARRAQDALGAVLAEYLHSVSIEHAVLVPVPLSKERLRERGYNQAERIARSAGKRLPPSITLDTAFLERRKNTIPQTNLGGRERRTNLQGAFAVARPPDPHTLYIVIDDVTTTGATLSACIKALSDAGALQILPIALAHSP
jgi:ComF family protein